MAKATKRRPAQYQGKDPEARARQLANLQRSPRSGRKKTVGLNPLVEKADIITFATRYLNVDFADRPGQELILRLMHGLPLPEGEVEIFVEVPSDGFVLEPKRVSWLELYRIMTGNETVFEPGTEPNEVVLCLGARSGKSFMFSIEANYEATRSHWRQYLSTPEEPAWAVVIATRQQQADEIVKERCVNLFRAGKIAHMMDGEPTASEICLTNGLRIAGFPCNTKAARGLAAYLDIFDECAWYAVEGPKQDTEIVNACVPRTLQFPGAKHVYSSTPAARRGLFYKMVQQGFQVPGRLTVKAPTWVVHPGLHRQNPKFFAGEFRRDPASFRREYGAEFDDVIDSYLPKPETIAALIYPGDVPYSAEHQYVGGIDQSGLTGNDAFAYSIGHKDRDRNKLVVDLTRSWSVREADFVIAKMAEDFKRYRVRQAMRDRYAAGWMDAALRRMNVEPVVAPAPQQVWQNLKTLIIAGRAELPCDADLQDGLLTTQVSYSKNNTPSIFHPRNAQGHADKAEAAARALFVASQDFIGPRRLTPEDELRMLRIKRAEEEYDPLTWELT